MRYTLLYLAANALTVQLWVRFPKFVNLFILTIPAITCKSNNWIRIHID